jgi:hypothetical protein
MTPRTYAKRPIVWKRERLCAICKQEVETDTLYAIGQKPYCPQCFYGTAFVSGAKVKVYKRNPLGQYVKVR